MTKKYGKLLWKILNSNLKDFRWFWKIEALPCWMRQKVHLICIHETSLRSFWENYKQEMMERTIPCCPSHYLVIRDILPLVIPLLAVIGNRPILHELVLPF